MTSTYIDYFFPLPLSGKNRASYLRYSALPIRPVFAFAFDFLCQCRVLMPGGHAGHGLIVIGFVNVPASLRVEHDQI